MDPTHPTITIDPGVSVEAYAWVSAAAVRDGEEKLVEKEHIYELDTTKYGLTQSTFLNYYKKLLSKILMDEHILIEIVFIKNIEMILHLILLKQVSICFMNDQEQGVECLLLLKEELNENEMEIPSK
ncbi:hypothetical protein GTU57_02550 [Spiroplasma citri]|nr:hypothetical protein [Spiroplasma citri]QIA74671.1 hypothetical protein GTU57_02550 [Spiroplasma citri]